MTRSLLVGIIVVVALVLAAVSFVLSSDDEEPATASTTVSPEAAQAESPYDFKDAGPDIDFGRLKDARFVSIVQESKDGLQSVMLNRGEAGFDAIVEAVSRADGSNQTAGSRSFTLSFVLPDRVTVTFDVDGEHNLLTRSGRTWKTSEDVAQLLASAMKGGA